MTEGRQPGKTGLPMTREDYFAADGVLLVTREPTRAKPTPPGQPVAVTSELDGPEILIAVWADGHVTALHGKIDMGTGVRTALAQIAADELDIQMDALDMVLGHTAAAPNLGPTIASSTIQISGVPLRQAAAVAREHLKRLAAERLNVPVVQLGTRNGRIHVVAECDAQGRGGRSLGYGELVAGRHIELPLDPEVVLKNPADYRLVGKPMPRLDIPAKATGELTFVHDMRVPGMLHGRVIRPPYVGYDAGDFIGHCLRGVERESISHIPGVVAVVVRGDFVGVVAEREEAAERAMRELVVHWGAWEGRGPLDSPTHVADAIRANAATRRVAAETGDVDAAIAQADRPMARTYVWPYQLHGSIGPSCAVASFDAGRLTVWAGTQNPHTLRSDLAKLFEMPYTQVDVVRMEASGCYGRNCADDVGADAALLSQAVGRPVRVQLTREQESLWEPKGAAQLMEIKGGLDAQGKPVGYDFATSYPSNGAETLALLLTGTVAATPTAYQMGDRTSVPPYDYGNLRVTINDMPAIVRASWLRGVSALPSSFAHESYIDELATEAGVDPVEFRLRYLKDPRAIDLIKAVADRARWIRHTAPRQQPAEGEILKGQGFAYARYIHGKFPGTGAAWSAWVADVEVNRTTGEVHVSRVVTGHDAGLMINPDGVRHQVHGNVLQTTSRALKEQVRFDEEGRPASREWGDYPLLSFREVPVIEVVTMPRPTEPPQGAGESASVPGTAAIANAIFDATGVRFREPPFTPEVVRAALQTEAGHPTLAVAGQTPPPALRRARTGWLAMIGAGIVGLAGAVFSWRPAMAPAAPMAPDTFSEATIERGRLLAAAGNCAVCHTQQGGIANAGGRPLETPFGTVYSTNLTPDPETGIGRWSFTAFQRAMREGISRDGHHLYPAFPYTSFTRTTDEDLLALFGYLMAQPAVKSAPPQTQLAFPFNQRWAMALWNTIYLRQGSWVPDPARSESWNRGSYLVNGLGHCSACHTPRDALGGERPGSAFLTGGEADGWQVPAIAGPSAGPVRWTESSFYDYLRTGFSGEHGVAGGPMAPVVRDLQALPDSDIRSMATYLASLQIDTESAPADHARTLTNAAQARIRQQDSRAARLFDGACAACHHAGDGPTLWGVNVPLAVNANVHSASPDNLLRVILEGVRQPARTELGYMPAFADALDDGQIAALARYIRERFAPEAAAWTDVDERVRALRRETVR